jgi:PIN domain
MLRLFVDTSVWLDLAQRRDAPRWIVPIRVLIHQGQLQLLVPPLIVEEFERNRPRVEEAVAAKVRERVRLLRSDLDAYAPDDRRRELLEGIAHHIPLVSAMTLQNFSEISQLLRQSRKLTATNVDRARVVQRGLDKKAPLHQNKNSVADALLIELYSSAVKRSRAKTGQYWFVTCNYQDFSVRNGDRRLPHPDLEEIFTSERSHYIYGVDDFKSALEDYFGDEFRELSEETEFLEEEPRTLEEILDAEQEFFDKVWYVRSVVTSDEDVAGYREDIREGMFAARARVEAKYGRKELRKPIGRGHDKAWEYGYINGKLAALRWVLGSEWDFLDT